MTSLFWQPTEGQGVRADYNQTDTGNRRGVRDNAGPVSGHLAGTRSGLAARLSPRALSVVRATVWTVPVLGFGGTMSYMLARISGQAEPRLVLVLAIAAAAVVVCMVAAVAIGNRGPGVPTLTKAQQDTEAELAEPRRGQTTIDAARTVLHARAQPPDKPPTLDPWVWEIGQAPDGEDTVRIG